MRINVHDYSGHLFQTQLSRALAARGHDVVHEFSSQWVTGHGRLERAPQDPEGLSFRSIAASTGVNKYDPVARVRFEMSYAKAWQAELEADHFDVVVACNLPLLALDRMRTYFARRRQPWVLWHQDIYSMGIAAEVGRRLPGGLARPVQRATTALERTQVRDADQVVAIGDAFRQKYLDWGLGVEHVHVIPNWAPLDDVTPGPRDNAFSREHRLPDGAVRLLYAGTLGRKHNPRLLLDVLDSARARGIDAQLIVCSEGVGVDDLAAAAGDRPDVLILPFQPMEKFNDVLASADALLAVLEPDAAAFSIPSKILTYLSAGRPILALIPESNPSALEVSDAGGFVATPTPAGAAAAGRWLAQLASTRWGLTELGRAARDYAERRFDIVTITDRFEGILSRASGLDGSIASMSGRYSSQFDGAA